MTPIVAALTGASFGAGMLLIVSGYRSVRSPSIESRVLPYVRDLPTASSQTPRSTELSRTLLSIASRWWTGLAEAVSGTAGVERRLARAGGGETVESFRARQWSAGVLGFIAATVSGLILWGVYHFAAIGIVGLSFAGCIAGLYWRDLELTASAKKYESQMAREFPVVADLLALSVAAGESPVAAIERVVRASNGPLSRELSKLISQIRSGGTTAEAFEALSARVGVPSVARFASTMAVAIERGTPLIAVLHAQAADAREASRRTLIESAGRREILMLMPVVFFVLPTVIIFAFYPGLVSLTFVSGS